MIKYADFAMPCIDVSVVFGETALRVVFVLIEELTSGRCGRVVGHRSCGSLEDEEFWLCYHMGGRSYRSTSRDGQDMILIRL